VVGAKASLAIRGVKAVILIEAFRRNVCTGMGSWIGGAGPLQGAFLAQAIVADASYIAGAPPSQLHKFGMYLSCSLEGKLLPKAQPPSHFGKDGPIFPGFSRLALEGRTEGDPSFGIGHSARLFAPLGSR